MGKLTKSDLNSLQKAGVVDAKTAKGITDKGLASERRSNVKKYMQTDDGKWVVPTLYFRGGSDAESSKEMSEFRVLFNKLVDQHATVMKTGK